MERKSNHFQDSLVLSLLLPEVLSEWEIYGDSHTLQPKTEGDYF